MTLHPSGAPAPDHSTQLNHLPGFAIPPAWRCHAVPPLHKGGFSLPCGTGPLPRWASPVPGLSYSLCPGKHNEPRQRQYGRGGSSPRREAGKRSGKNLVFPREPGAASPTVLQVIFPFGKITRRGRPRRGPAILSPGRSLGQHPPQRVFWLQAHQHGIFRRGSVIAGADTGFLKAELFIKGLGGAV